MREVGSESHLVGINLEIEMVNELGCLPNEGAWAPQPPVQYKDKVYILNWSWQEPHLTIFDTTSMKATNRQSYLRGMDPQDRNSEENSSSVDLNESLDDDAGSN
jgi:hypothetical protein